MNSLTLYPIAGLPLIYAGDDLPLLLFDRLEATVGVQDNDVLVVAQKVISKAEGAVVDLSAITPSERAREIAQQTGRDPRLCQVYIDEAKEIIAIQGDVIVTRHKLGFVGSSSGVDRSNIDLYAAGIVVLLPRDPDQSAQAIRDYIFAKTKRRIAVVINDSWGRDYRDGSVGTAIGIAGISPIEIYQKTDLFGNPSNSRIALIDELAAAASILMGQKAEGVPAVLIRGVSFTVVEDAHITDILK